MKSGSRGTQRGKPSSQPTSGGDPLRSFALLLIGLTLVSLYYHSRQIRGKSAKPVGSAPAPPVSLASPAEFRLTSKASTSIAEIPHRDTCQQFWQNILTVDLSDRRAQLLALPPVVPCPNLPPELAFRQSMLFTACNGTAEGMRTGGCILSLIHYRAYINDWMTRTSPLSEIRDPGILSQKFMVAHLAPDTDSSEHSSMVGIAERWLETDPNSPSAMKAFLISAGNGNHDSNDAFWDYAERSLDIAKNEFPDSPALPLLETWLNSRGAINPDAPNRAVELFGGFHLDDVTMQ